MVLSALAASAIPAPATAAETPSVSVTVSPAAFSPNGDGTKDALAVTVVASDADSLVVEAAEAAGSVVRTLASGPAPPEGRLDLVWDGRPDDETAPVPDGRYVIVARATDRVGDTADATAPVAVDTAPPSVAVARIEPEPLVSVRSVAFEVRAHDDAGTLVASYAIVGPGERLVRRDEVALSPGTDRLWWPARAASGRPVSNGLYLLRLSATDEAGNTAWAAPARFRVLRPVSTTVIRRIPEAGRLVALTFDDCNSVRAWRRILDVLSARGVKATFFCNGSRVARFAAVARRTAREGHSLGSHSWSHPFLARLPASSVRSQLLGDVTAWWRVRALPLHVRPPYGAYAARTLRVAGDVGFRRTVLWDVDPRDWTRPGAAAIAARVVRGVRPGSIVVLHVQDQTARALGPMITRLRARGLRPSSLDEMIAAAARA